MERVLIKKALEKYKEAWEITSFYLEGDIPSKKLDNAINTFALGIERKDVVALYDSTLFGSAKEGVVFTESKLYCKTTLEKPMKIWYEDIEKLSIKKFEKKKDCNKELEIITCDGKVLITTTLINKTPLKNLLNELKEISSGNIRSDKSINLKQKNNITVIGGLGTSNYGTVNKLYDEEKFNANQGHGFAAERANDLYDKVTFKDTKIMGDSNIKNGADRIVDGVEIQSKYCKTGSRCISECFEDGKMRYTVENGQKPMQIEVPSDLYNDAVKAMENRIENGEVPGVTDPKEAKNIVRKGHVTYAQAKNIAKAGTVESLVYDSVNGAIISVSAFGVSAVITFATAVWSGEEFDTAIKTATYAGLKIGGTAFATSVLASQFSKAGLNSALVSSSEAIVNMIGPKASAVLVNAFRNGSNIYGAAAMKSAAKLLRGNVITAGVTVIVLSSFDIVSIFRGRISGSQLFKNIANTASGVAGGVGGWVAGATAGAALGSAVPIVGNAVGGVVGGVIGSLAGGAVAGKVSGVILDEFIEDDVNELVEIIEDEFKKIALEYMLNQKEAEKAIDRLRDKLDGKKLKDMFASNNKKVFARELVEKLIINEIKKRKRILIPTNEEMRVALVAVLEDISNEEESIQDI
ncbi:MAG: hypothetical protein ACRCWM_07650 [Sarcina sp.]